MCDILQPRVWCGLRDTEADFFTFMKAMNWFLSSCTVYAWGQRPYVKSLHLAIPTGHTPALGYATFQYWAKNFFLAINPCQRSNTVKQFAKAPRLRACAIWNAQSAMRNPHCAIHSRGVTYAYWTGYNIKWPRWSQVTFGFPFIPKTDYIFSRVPEEKVGFNRRSWNYLSPLISS